MIRQRRSTLAVFLVVALLCRFAVADAYDPPANYYSYATGTTGTTLKQRLKATIDTIDDSAIPNTAEVLETPQSYDAARTSLQVTDAVPGKPGFMYSVYDRGEINVAAIHISGQPPGWDSGATWNREHTWPRSRGVNSSGPDDSDLFELRPSLTSSNGSREDLNFGGAYGAQSYGTVNDGGQTHWYPGNADAGMIARQEFYMAVRYDGTDGSTQDLELGAGFVGNPSGAEDDPPQLGNLTRLIEWNYAAAPDSFERNRNQVIFTSYQHNRNPFTDHPEWVWSVFKDQANHSQVSIAGSTVNSDGSSTKNIDLGRVFVGGTVPAAQISTLNKTGDDGTYASVTTSGLASASISGSFNAFAITTGGSTVSKSISVGIVSSTGTEPNIIQTTSTAGIKSGTVVVDNLDITTGGGAGKGANDGNDTFNVTLNVLDHMTPSFTSPSLQSSKTLDFGNIAIDGSAPTLNFNVFDLNGTVGSTANMDFDTFTPSGSSTAFTTNLAPSAGSLQIAAGTSETFAASLNLTSVGTFTAMYTLNFSDENLTGAQNKSVTLTLTGIVRLPGDFNNDGSVDAGDFVVWQQALGQSVTTAYSGADGNGNLSIDSADYDVWRAHFGQTASGSGSSLAAAVPEPATLWLLAASAAFVCHCLRRTR